jgi:hypothetical protein
VLKKYILARWETSVSFAEYLDKLDVKQAAEQAGIKLKEKHTVVPHVSRLPSHPFCLFLHHSSQRVCTPIDGPANGIPIFKDKNSSYLNVGVLFILARPPCSMRRSCRSASPAHLCPSVLWSSAACKSRCRCFSSKVIHMILRGIYVISTYVNTLDVTGCKQLNVRSIITDCLNEWRRAIESIVKFI